MVIAHHDSLGRVVALELKPTTPHRTALARQAFLALTAVMLAEGVWFATMGVWLVLLYALLLAVAVGWGMGQIASPLGRGEKVEIGTDVLAVAKGRRARHEFPRAWAQVRLQRDEGRRGREATTRLLIRAQGHETEIGRFLGEGERRELAGRLRRLLGVERYAAD